MNYELDPNQRPKELGELSQLGTPEPSEQELQDDDERPLDTVKGTELPMPSIHPELGDTKYGK